MCVCIYIYAKCMLQHFSHVQLFATLWTVTLQAPLSMAFSWQEYWSRLPFPPPGTHTHTHTHTYVIYIYIYIYIPPLFLRFFSHSATTEYWVELPVLYSRSLLVMYFIYSSVCMSIPISYWNHYLEDISVFPCSLQHYSQQPRYSNNPGSCWWMSG